jgi:ATP-dependent RNA helicase RhlE
MTFKTFDFDARIFDNLQALGYTTPTPIQLKGIPPVMEGSDVIGLAQTGTGKTAAFALPILQKLLKGPGKRVRALIVAPTRELTEQTHKAFGSLALGTRIRTVSIYGGVNINPQIDALRRGVEIVSACPGRLLDHVQRRTIDLSTVEVLVLDEADRMFDMGFLPDVRRIIGCLPVNRQTLLFSATMPSAVKHLTREVLRHPVTVQIGDAAPAATVSHTFYPVEMQSKRALLETILANTRTGPVIIFTRTKHRSKTLARQLERCGYAAVALNGNLTQSKRQQALDGFHQGRYKILVATDIAARGIDVSKVSHVINYDIPDTVDAYTHRIGRTGRAREKGEAFTFISEIDRGLELAIKKTLGSKLRYCKMAVS